MGAQSKANPTAIVTNDCCPMMLDRIDDASICSSCCKAILASGVASSGRSPATTADHQNGPHIPQSIAAFSFISAASICSWAICFSMASWR